MNYIEPILFIILIACFFLQQVAEETSHLAPHGVPSNPIPRALSNSRLNEMNPNGGPYGTYQTTGGNLDIPGGGGAHNPFAQ